MNCGTIKFLLLLVGLASLAGLWQCTNGLADGGSEAGNAFIVGTIIDQNGKPATHTIVTLIPLDYNPELDPPLADSLSDTTNDGGGYSFSIKNTNHAFNIYAIHMLERTRLIIPEVLIFKDTTYVPTNTLKNGGILKIFLPQIIDTTRGYLFLEGTPISKNLAGASLPGISPRPSIGFLLVLDSVPESLYPAIYYDIPDDQLMPLSLTNNITVTANDTTVIGDTIWWESYNSDNSGLPVNNVRDIFFEDDGTVWFATHGGGVARLTNGHWTVYNANSDLKTDYIKSIYEKSEDTLWITTDLGVNYFDGEKWGGSQGILPINVTGIDEDSKQNKWMSARGFGLLSRDSSLSTFNSNLQSNNVSFFKFDQNDTLWCATSAGIEKLKDSFYHIYTQASTGLQTNDIFAMLFCHNNSKWFAGYKGVARLHQKEWNVYDGANSFFLQDSVFTIAEAPNGEVWFGTELGVVIFDGRHWYECIGGAYSFLENKKVYSINFDAHNNVWLGTANSGVIVCNPSGNVKY